MVLPPILDPFANTIKAFLDKRTTRWAMIGLIKVATIFDKERRRAFERYLSFITVGSSASQREVFLSLIEPYKNIPDARFVALTLNMDHMSHFPSNHAPINSQLAEVRELKKQFPNQLFPFVSVDPRHLGGQELLDWLKKYINGDNFFCGIKLYPAKGFFPFDPRLDEVYKWAAAEGIPVMTHCTRSGSYFIDTIDRSVVTPKPPTLNDKPELMQPIYDRIDKVLKDDKVKKKNASWCNLFTHPEHYLPVLDKYKDLKLCFAHFGGSSQVAKPADPGNPAYLGPNWFTEVQDIMKNPEYTNIYTDISYTLFEPAAMDNIIKWYDAAGDLQKRILYGTDFYMTEQELPERFLLANAIAKLGGRMDQMARINPAKYLESDYYVNPS
jgi:predicted TIM-barrel fold metal-dependent hydrolase